MNAVDVVVPCYNYARYLRFCVESVLAQRDVDVRVLIIDDKSSDDTPAVCQALADADPRVVIRRHEQNKGLIATANEGMEWVEAPYWLLLSADDALTPGALARAVRMLEARPEAGMVYGLARIVLDDEAPPLLDDVLEVSGEVVTGREFLAHTFNQGNTVPSPSAVVRTELQKRLGGYDKKFPHTSDLEMWSRIAVHAPIAVIAEPQAFYRRHRSNMTLLYTGSGLADRSERLDTYIHITQRWSATMSELGDILAAARAKLGSEALLRAYAAQEDGQHEEFKACIAFVQKYWPSYWRTWPWWRLMALRVIGQRATRQLRGAKALLFGSRSEASAPSETSLEWGDWPRSSKHNRT